MSDAIATEAREIVRRAAGGASGLTVKGQIRQAARNLGYSAENRRVREAWYGRASNWSARAIRDLQDRYDGWRLREAERRAAQDAADRDLLADALVRLGGRLHRALVDLAVCVDPRLGLPIAGPVRPWAGLAVVVLLVVGIALVGGGTLWAIREAVPHRRAAP